MARRSEVSLVLVAAVAVLIGGALGRFITAGSGGDAAPSGSGVAASAAGSSVDLGERIRRLEAAAAANPEDLVALQQLGAAYVQRAAEVGDPAFYPLAEEAFDRADVVEPDHPATLLGRGSLALALHQFADAKLIGERLRADLPNSSEPLGVLVDAEVELGAYDRAAAHVQAMLDLDPGTAALARASYLRELHGDLEGAVTAMRQAATAAPADTFDRGVVTALLGDLHWGRGDLSAARRAYEEAQRAAPGLPAAEVGLARVEAAEGDVRAAIARLERLTERVPLPDGLILLVELHRAAGDAEEAAAAADLVRAVTALQRDAGQVVDLELALFEADHGDPEVALTLAERAFAVRPDNIFAQHALAWAHARSGDAEAAVPLMEDALRLGTLDARLRYHAALIFEAVGSTDRARAELAIALAAAPPLALGDPADVEATARRLDFALPARWR